MSSFALERAPESYDSMMSGKARFRCVLDDTAKAVESNKYTMY